MEAIDRLASVLTNLVTAHSSLLQGEGELFGRYFEIIDFFLDAIHSNTLSRDEEGKDNGK